MKILSENRLTTAHRCGIIEKQTGLYSATAITVRMLRAGCQSNALKAGGLLSGRPAFVVSGGFSQRRLPLRRRRNIQYPAKRSDQRLPVRTRPCAAVNAFKSFTVADLVAVLVQVLCDAPQIIHHMSRLQPAALALQVRKTNR